MLNFLLDFISRLCIFSKENEAQWCLCFKLFILSSVSKGIFLLFLYHEPGKILRNFYSLAAMLCEQFSNFLLPVMTKERGMG